MTKPQSHFADVCMDGTVQEVQALLADPSVDPVADNWLLEVLPHPTLRKRAKIIAVLLKDGRMDPMLNNGLALRNAMEWDRCACVLAFLADPRVDPAAIDIAIGWASNHCEEELIDRLLKDPRTDPSVMDNCAIKMAACFGKTDFVRRILADPRVDPSVNNNEPRGWALRSNYDEIVDLLERDPRFRPTRRDP
jgi:hypothetical protein